MHGGRLSFVKHPGCLASLLCTVDQVEIHLFCDWNVESSGPLFCIEYRRKALIVKWNLTAPILQDNKTLNDDEPPILIGSINILDKDIMKCPGGVHIRTYFIFAWTTP